MRRAFIGVAAFVVGGALGVGVAGLPEHVSSDITIESPPPTTGADTSLPAATGPTTVSPTTVSPTTVSPTTVAPTTSLTITTGVAPAASSTG